MIYVVLFTDSPAHGEARRRLMPAHLAFLEQHQAHIHAAGPLQETGDGRGAGGLWLVEAQSPEAVREMVQQDPFWPTGLRELVRILRWQQVFADGGRLI